MNCYCNYMPSVVSPFRKWGGAGRFKAHCELVAYCLPIISPQFTMLGLRISGLGKGFIRSCTTALRTGQVAVSKSKKRTIQAVSSVCKHKMPENRPFCYVTHGAGCFPVLFLTAYRYLCYCLSRVWHQNWYPLRLFP